jgi:hypothetical protein
MPCELVHIPSRLRSLVCDLRRAGNGLSMDTKEKGSLQAVADLAGVNDAATHHLDIRLRAVESLLVASAHECQGPCCRALPMRQTDQPSERGTNHCAA